MVDLDEGRQADLIVTLLRLKEAESVVDRRQRGDDLDVVGHFGHLIVDQDDNPDLARPDNVLSGGSSR